MSSAVPDERTATSGEFYSVDELSDALRHVSGHLCVRNELPDLRGLLLQFLGALIIENPDDFSSGPVQITVIEEGLVRVPSSPRSRVALERRPRSGGRDLRPFRRQAVSPPPTRE